MIDWQLVIGRLHPVSAYHWKGDGMNDTYDSIGEWRDPLTKVPTEQECLSEWDKYLQEQAAEVEKFAELAAAKTSIVDLTKSAVGVRIAELTAAQRNALIACLLLQAGAINPKTLTVKPLGEWIK